MTYLQVLVVEDGKIRKYDGDFDDYRNELIKEITAELDEDEK
jgi:ATP-binding cassette subfamily F protein 1